MADQSQPGVWHLGWREAGWGLAGLLLVLAAELLNHRWLSPLAILPLVAGLIYAARRGWPLWSAWWAGSLLGVVGLTLLIWWPGPTRPPALFVLWEALVFAAVCLAGVWRWRRDGYWAALVLFPCGLECTRFILLDDLSAGAPERSGWMSLAAVLIYAVVAVRVFRQPVRSRWVTLFVAALLYLLATLALSWPVAAILVLYPIYLPTLLGLLLFSCLPGVFTVGFRPHLTRVLQLALVSLSAAGLVFPWLPGDVFISPPQAAQATVTGARRPIIIDTDMSHDDYVAILYLLQQPDLDILAVTVVDGVAHVGPGTENARRLLALAGRADIPVASGPDRPLVGPNIFPADMRFLLDFSLRGALPKVAPSAEALSAADLIRRQVDASPSPVTLLALGPLTNVALALRAEPALAARLASITISGGAVNVPGTIPNDIVSHPNAVAEWNLFLDPQAADEVFRSGAQLTLVPLDVTHSTGPHPLLLHRAFVDRVASTARGRDTQLMARIMQSWFLSDGHGDAVPLWDAPVAAIALNPAICTDWRELPVRIELGPEAVAGQTVVDANLPPNARVCLGGDQAAFEAAYLAAARGLQQ